MTKSLTKSELVQQLKAFGLKSGDCIYLKVAMRELGPVEGGARTLLEAVHQVVGKEGSIVCSSFVSVYPLALLKFHPRIKVDQSTASYAGAVANEILTYPGVRRSSHPIQKFAALGKMASFLVDDHNENTYAYDVFRKMAEIGGKTLKIGSDEKVRGVGTTHVAVGLLGFRQKRPRVGVRFVNKQGKSQIFQMNWAGMCQQGFQKFDKEYESVPGAVLAKGHIGAAEAKLTDMKTTLETELAILAQDPKFFMCKDPNCVNCRTTWEFSDKKPLGFFLISIFTFRFSNVNSFLKNYLNADWQPQKGKEKISFMNKQYYRR